MTWFSKTGAQFQQDSTAGRQWLGNSPLVKAINSNTAPMLGAAPSGAIRIFRYVFNSQSLSTAPASAYSTVVSQLGGHPADYIEAYNEQYQDSPQSQQCPTPSPSLPEYITWMVGFVQAAHAGGHKVAGFSFGVGHPCDINDWLLIAKAGFAGVDRLSVHEYWGVNWGPLNPYTALRHREIHNLLVQNGYGNHPNFLITETGVDSVGDGSLPGWKANGLTPQQFISQIQQFDNAIAQDGYVDGALLFVSGAYANFANFEINDLVNYLASPPVTCGTQNAACCTSGAPCSSADLICSNGFCIGCGYVQESCCTNNVCLGANLTCQNGSCFPPTGSCGGANEPCCNGTTCNAGLNCQGGNCVAPASSSCIADPDCIAVLGNGYFCQGAPNGSCQPCPSASGMVRADVLGGDDPGLLGTGLAAVTLAGLASLDRGN